MAHRTYIWFLATHLACDRRHDDTSEGPNVGIGIGILEIQARSGSDMAKAPGTRPTPSL